jgi:hypothetical protein
MTESAGIGKQLPARLNSLWISNGRILFFLLLLCLMLRHKRQREAQQDQ